MRRISIALAVTIFLLASLVTAQQTTDNTSTNSGRSGYPVPPPGTVTGMGTTDYIPIWTSSTSLSNSVMYQTGGNVGIATTTPSEKLDVNGAINAATKYKIVNNTVLSIGSFADQNLFLGVGAGHNNVAGQGVANVFAGHEAGYSNTTGAGNTFTGWYAGYLSNGCCNTFSGYSAGFTDTTGSSDTFSGDFAGADNTTGDYNTFIGDDAGVHNTTGSNNTYLGESAGQNNTTGSNNIYLGAGCTSSCTESNVIRIGGDNGLGYGSQNRAFIAGVYGSTSSGGIPVYINSAGQLGTTLSSLRFKEQVRDMGDSTSALMKLRPVTFLYKPEYADGERTLQYGLLAEEVAQVYPELVAYDKDGQPYSVRYQYLSTMLLNEVQKEHSVVAAQQREIVAQEQEIESLKQQLQLQNASLQERLSKLESYVATQTQMKIASDVQPATPASPSGDSQ